MTPGETDILLVIDVQNDFCPGGALAIEGGDEVVPVINRLARRFAHVVLTQDWHPPGHHSFASSHTGRQPFETHEAPYGTQMLWPDHCVQGTAGAEFHPLLDVPRAELVLRKGFRTPIDSYSAFFENDRKTATGLIGYLRERGIERIFLAGLAYDFCVRYSAEDGAASDFATVVIGDACRSVGMGGSVAEADAAFARAEIKVIESAAI